MNNNILSELVVEQQRSPFITHCFIFGDFYGSGLEL